MNHNKEREFKTVIPKTHYDAIIAKFKLEDNVFLQTNHYFDTENLDLSKQDIVLRIRQKGDRFFKVTIKKQHPEEAFESHVLLTKQQALAMLKDGFNTSQFFEHIHYDVHYKTSIDNFRASLPYHNGVMFIDQCVYCGKTDYELEYEVNDEIEGFINFDKFLKSFDISFEKTRRKSDRAFSCTL